MDIHLHNTLTKQKELFTPITPGQVSMYHCGPTVYNYAHVGNLRAYILADILRRVFEFNGYTVKQIINITDIGHLTDDGDEGEDKMTKALKRHNMPLTLAAMREVAEIYYQAFLTNLDELNIERAAAFPFASDNIAEDIHIIEQLLQKGAAYSTTDGIYFDTSTFPDYGKLGGGVSGDEHRIEQQTEKRQPRDFAVWKFNDEHGYDASFGKGFPGWHIECSAMSMKYLGDTFDIHTGGIDHIPVHHNNEIAQSETFTGKPFVHYWLHNAHITVSGDKMAKSGDNMLTLDALRDLGISPLAYRYWILQAKYSTRMDFNVDALKASQVAYEKLVSELAALPDGGVVSPAATETFLASINDDLNTPAALAYVWTILSDKNMSAADKKATILSFDAVLGLRLADGASHKDAVEYIRVQDADIKITLKKGRELTEALKQLIHDREIARRSKDWSTSDSIRDTLNQQGVTVLDTEDGIIIE